MHDDTIYIMNSRFCFICDIVCVCEQQQALAPSSNWPTNAPPDLNEFLAILFSPTDPSPSYPNASAPVARSIQTRGNSQNDESFANDCFPHPHQYGLRAKLISLLQQSWLSFNQPEPAGAFQFLLLDAEHGKQQCSICSKFYRRGGRALEHIRTHLGHKPFICSGGYLGCSRSTCGKLFHGKESLKDHQRRDQIQCENCHLIILRKNRGRHQRKGCPRT